MKLFNLLTAATVAATGIAAVAPTDAVAGFVKTVQVETIYNTPEHCPGLPDGMPVPANVMTVKHTVNNHTTTQRTILKTFCF